MNWPSAPRANPLDQPISFSSLLRWTQGPAGEVLAVFLVFWATVIVLHAGGFQAPMVYDSQAFIQSQTQIFETEGLVGVLRIVPMRPLFMGSLYLNYLLTGMDPLFFRLFNSAVLAATGTALAVMGFLIVRILAPALGSCWLNPRMTGFLIGLIFVVHPLQPLVVLYIWQRSALMACFFYYAAMAAYLAARTGFVQPAWKAYLACGLLFTAGMYTKENVATLPAILVLTELTLFRQTLVQTIRRAGLILAVSFPGALAYVLTGLWLRTVVSPESATIFQEPGTFLTLSGLSPLMVGLTACRVVFSYLATILVPVFHEPLLINALVVSVSLWDPPVTAIACGGVAGLVVVGVLSIRRAPLIALGILSYLIMLLPESTLIPVYLCLGYRAILPMAAVLWVGLGVIIALGNHETVKSWDRAPKVITACVCLVGVGFGIMTFWEARHWDPLILWERAYNNLPPLSERVEHGPYLDIASMYGNQLVLHQRYEEAIRVLTPLEHIGPRRGSSFSPEGLSSTAARLFRNPRGVIKASALTNLGRAHALSGDPVTAISWYRKALALDPLSPATHINIGLALKQTGDLQKAIQHFQTAIQLDPRSVSAYNNLGLVLDTLGNKEKALQAFLDALKLNPNSPEIHYNLANVLLGQGNLPKAIAHYHFALSAKPNYPEAHGNLGTALLNAGMAAEAIPHLERALLTFPENADIHFLLGVALNETGRHAEALPAFAKALSLDPGHQEARKYLENLTSGSREPQGIR